MAKTKPVGEVTGNITKAVREAREKAEGQVFKFVAPKANEVTNSNLHIKKIFNKLKKMSDLFSESNEEDLNSLAYFIYHKKLNQLKMNELDIDDDEYERYLNRIEKYSKQIKPLQDSLAMTVSQKLKISNDLANTYLKEIELTHKLEPEREEKNPLYAVLEAGNE